MSIVDSQIKLRATCPLCNSNHRNFLYKKASHAINLSANFFKCEGCDFVYSEEVLTSPGVAAFYKEKYLKSNYTKYAQFYNLKLMLFKTRLREIVKIQRNKNSRLAEKKITLLDLGCGAGASMTAAHQLGLEVTGIEVSKDAAELAKANQVGRVYCSNLDELDSLNLGQFDLVVLFDILDHVADPLKVLDSAGKLLKPGGTMFIEVCNIESIYAKLMGKHYTHVIPFEHFSYFSPATLKLLVTKCGLIPGEAADLKRPISLDFLAATLKEFNPFLEKLLLLKLIPKRLREKIFFIPVGVMTMTVHKADDERGVHAQ